MRKIIVLLLITGVWLTGCMSGAEVLGPGKGAPIVLDLNRFGEEMLIADQWVPLLNNDNTKGANVSLAIDPKAGKCLKIDYKDTNTFAYNIKPTDLSGYGRIEFKMKGDGTKSVFVFGLVDENGVEWGYGPFFTDTTEWVPKEAILTFPTFGKEKTLDLKKIVRIQFYANEYGAKLEEFVRQDFIMNTRPADYVSKLSTIYFADFKLARLD